MKVYVQWSLSDPQDWQLVDIATAASWRNLPKKNEPSGSDTVDSTPGWIYALNVQGVIFEGYDHYGVSPSAGALSVMAWNDDPADWPVGERYGHVWTLRDPAPDVRLGGKVNTRQSLTIYGEAGYLARLPESLHTSDGPVTIRPWSEFPFPVRNMTFHGIWVSDPLAALHVQRRAHRGWREWAGG